ncbi:MAG: hypothetical protein RMK30_06510 [Anaerolineae bacterium]|nr:hypothetical protein [Anaerolineae bacterium]MDW8102512.1 hypothetical protein [Anaerolineae bacterium]
MPKISRTHLGFALAFLAGFLLGWLVIGWWLWPVQWINTDPWDLRPEFKKQYILMAADSYALSSNPELLRERFRGWPPEDLAAFIDEVKRENPGNELLASRLETIRSALNLPEPGITPAVPEPPKRGLKVSLIFWGSLALLIFLIALGVIYRAYKDKLTQWARQSSRRSTKSAPEPKVVEGEYREFPLLARYSSKYTYGDVRFAESFPIESPQGDYLGECGIESSELVGSGDPPRIGAFEVWLFDKNLNRTISKIITIPGADEAMRASLKSFSISGEVLQAEKGGIISLVTDNLEVRVTINDLALGNGGTFFTQLSTTFEIFQKKR